MTDEYIKKADAYKIALHDGSDIAAKKIADLKPEPVKPVDFEVVLVHELHNDLYEIDIRADGSVLIRPKM